MGRPGERTGAGGVRDHGKLAGEHRGRGKPAYQGKSAAKSTIFLVCRVREHPLADADAIYWEEVEPKVADRSAHASTTSRRPASAASTSISPVSVPPCRCSARAGRSRGRPVTRHEAKPKRNKVARAGDDDPYAVRPEDALDAARREVKRWRMDQLATVKRQHHLDPLTEWFVLAWDAFKAPKFPVDEALKLARVVGLDFDREVKNNVCEVKGSDVTLWDSQIRRRKNKLGPVGGAIVLDTLHQCARSAASKTPASPTPRSKKAELLADPTLMTLEALLNVLPYPSQVAKAKTDEGGLAGSAADFDALERLRKLAASPTPFPKPSAPSKPKTRRRCKRRCSATRRKAKARNWTLVRRRRNDGLRLDIVSVEKRMGLTS